MKTVTAHRLHNGLTEIRVNGSTVSLVCSDRSETELAAHYHPHEVFARMVEGDPNDTDLEILHAPTL